VRTMGRPGSALPVYVGITILLIACAHRDSEIPGQATTTLRWTPDEPTHVRAARPNTPFITVTRAPGTVLPECDSANIPNPFLGEEASWSWQGITIGVSTEQDVVAAFGEPDRIHTWRDERGIRGCVYRYQRPNLYPTFILAGDRVIGIDLRTEPGETGPAGQLETIDNVRELFGRADIVGYSGDLGAGYRSVVWLDEGILAQAIVSGPIVYIIYFTPMTESEFADSMWSGLVLYTNPTLETDYADHFPRDPFDW
jgi:hypothetical protein